MSKDNRKIYRKGETFDWTPERLQQLRDLKAQGVQQGEIARRLKTTTNSVQGKWTRLRKEEQRCHTDSASTASTVVEPSANAMRVAGGCDATGA